MYNVYCCIYCLVAVSLNKLKLLNSACISCIRIRSSITIRMMLSNIYLW